MRKIVERFVEYPIYANLIIVFVVVAGLTGLFTMKKAYFPESESRIITVSVFYPGASPVEMEEGVDGLVHISDLSWHKRIKHPSEFCKVDDMMDVVVLEIDRESRRISLGHKQLEENPWDAFESTFVEGSTHQGTIIENKDKLDSTIIYNRDFGYDYFGFKTFNVV